MKIFVNVNFDTSTEGTHLCMRHAYTSMYMCHASLSPSLSPLLLSLPLLLLPFLTTGKHVNCGRVVGTQLLVGYV